MPDVSNYDSRSWAVFALIVLVFILIAVVKCCIDSNKEKYKFPKHPTPQVTIEDILTVPSPHEILLSSAGSSVVMPPYPVEARHPTPENKSVPAPGPGFTAYNPPYPTHHPHPVPDVDYCAPPPIGISSAPYPPPGPTPYSSVGPPNSAPYPSYPGHDSQPPSYSEVVGQPSAQPLIPKEGYTKQAPYNPNY